MLAQITVPFALGWFIGTSFADAQFEENPRRRLVLWLTVALGLVAAVAFIFHW